MTRDADLFDLAGEVVLVTGGGGILGTRFAEALAEQGARVAVVDRDGERAKTAAELASGGGAREVRAYEADVSDAVSLRALRQAVERELGAVSVLVNNAATKTEHFFEPFETFPLKDWQEVLAVNTTGAMLACREFGSGMAKRGRGSIVNILSIYGIVAPDHRIYEGAVYGGQPINTPAVYSVSKAALLGLTRYLATYWATQGVRVNAITPGGVFSGQNETFVEQYSARVPMRRMAHPEELCGALIFLASSASSYVTGQNIVVDGGLTVW